MMIGLLIVLCIFCYMIVSIILVESEDDDFTILFWPIALPFRWYMKTDNSWWIRECVESLKGEKR